MYTMGVRADRESSICVVSHQIYIGGPIPALLSHDCVAYTYGSCTNLFYDCNARLRCIQQRHTKAKQHSDQAQICTAHLRCHRRSSGASAHNHIAFERPVTCKVETKHIPIRTRMLQPGTAGPNAIIALMVNAAMY